MDDSSYRLNFDPGKKNKILHHSWVRKNMLKLVKFQSLVAKCWGKYSPTKFANFVLRTGKCTTFGPNVVHFPVRNTN
jgi:hypothetical protein